MTLIMFTGPSLIRSLCRSFPRDSMQYSSPCASINARRHMFWEPTFRGPPKYMRDIHRMNRAPLGYQLRIGYEATKERCKSIFNDIITFRRHWDVPRYNDLEVIKFWDFSDPKIINSFIPTCDSLWEEGYSTASFTRSPTGCALFSGFVDADTLPADRTIERAGWAAVSSPEARGNLMSIKAYDWSPFTHLCLRVRGDGRRYKIHLRTPGDFDVTWFNAFAYHLYTHGGPYWQEVRIPFSRFFLQTKGFLRDNQCEPMLSQIQSVSIVVTDRVTGPYALEIDYIGLSIDFTHEEKCAYEGYAIKEAGAHLQ